jgi:uracil-DNA glycosylase family 4
VPTLQKQPTTKFISIPILHRHIANCNRCSRLREYCCEVAKEKRRAYLNWDYWGKPIAGFGDPNASLWIIGLAPAAHGGNRTGRVFTGDRSGDFLYAALHRMGFANQATSVKRGDGLELNDCYISAAVRCAPPGNKPLPEEIANCAPYLDEEWRLLRKKRVILALGKIAWDAAISLVERQECAIPKPRPVFGHGEELDLKKIVLMGSYHVSQQNTFTGKLTAAMFDEVLQRCRKISGQTIPRSRPALDYSRH